MNILEPKNPSLMKLDVATVVHGSLSHFDTFQFIITTNLEEVVDKKEHQLPLVLRKRRFLFICQVTEFIVATTAEIPTFHLFGGTHIKEYFNRIKTAASMWKMTARAEFAGIHFEILESRSEVAFLILKGTSSPDCT